MEENRRCEREKAGVGNGGKKGLLCICVLCRCVNAEECINRLIIWPRGVI